MELLHSLVLCDLYFFLTYGASFGPLEIGYRATSAFDSGWMENFGGQSLYWVLFNLGKVNQWFQYNNLKVFLGFFYVGCYFVIYSYLLLEWFTF